MRLRTTLIIACVCGLASVLMVTASADDASPSSVSREQPAQKNSQDTAPVFDLQQAESWRNEVIDDVEAFAQRAFKQTPKVEIVTQPEFLAAWERELRAQVAGVPAGADVEKAIALAMADNAAKAPLMFARCSYVDHAIYIPAGNAAPLLTTLKIEREALPDIMKLVIAHELAHALHHEHVQFDPTYRSRTEDEHKALDAVMEGFAMLVQCGVADRLGLAALNERFMKASTLSDGAMESVAAFARHFNESYIAGLKFFQHHQPRGMDHVWAILAAPPRTYAQITQPEKYGQAVVQELNIARLFAGLDTLLSTKGGMPTMLTVAGTSAARVFALLGPERSNSLAAQIERAHTWMVREGETVRSVCVYELRDPAASAALCQAMDDLFDKQFGTGESFKRMGATVTSQRDALQTGGASGFVQRQNIVDPKRGGASILMSAAAKDHVVVQIIATGSDLSADAPQRVTAMLFDRLASAEAYLPVAAADESNPLVTALKRIKPLLAEGTWTETIRPHPKAAVERLLAKDVKGHVAFEMGWQEDHSVSFEATSDSRESRRMLMVALLKFADPDSSAAVAEALGKNLHEALAQLRQAVPGITPGEIVTSTLHTGEPCWCSDTTMTFKGQTMRMRFTVVQLGKRIVYIVDTNNALRAEQVGDVCKVLRDDPK